MNNTTSWRTAITRTKPSRPMAMLNKQHRLVGRTLDYGCGKGHDAICFDMEAYDPHFMPVRPEGFYDTVTCTYVLNVVAKKEQEKILKDIRDLLVSDGVAYITVRRDFKKEYKTKDTIQRLVELPFVVINECDGYCTYMMTKYLNGMPSHE